MVASHGKTSHYKKSSPHLIEVGAKLVQGFELRTEALVEELKLWYPSTFINDMCNSA